MSSNGKYSFENCRWTLAAGRINSKAPIPALIKPGVNSGNFSAAVKVGSISLWSYIPNGSLFARGNCPLYVVVLGNMVQVLVKNLLLYQN